MASYVKKPVIVEAFQYDGDFMNCDGEYYVPEWAVKAQRLGFLYYSNTKESPSELFIKTLEGPLHVGVGDYLIKGVAGEIYPCKVGIFNQTYSLLG